MSFLACSSGVQHDFDDLPPSAVEESPGTPARFRSLRPVITSTGLVRYAALVEDPSLLLHNVAVVQDYSELDWGSKEDSPRNIAFYCNAYNIWAMYLVFKKMRKHGLAWHGNSALQLSTPCHSYRNAQHCLTQCGISGPTTVKTRAHFFYFTNIIVAGQKTTLLKACWTLLPT